MPEHNSTAQQPRRTKIAILGGGLGGLAAAYQLTSEPGWFERYEITIYQKGWRLGGKGASGRGDHGRIEEHGLHCFWGFYDNAFSMLHDCYQIANRQSGPIRTIEQAFDKLSAVYFIDQKNGRWRRYQMHFPEGSGKPWESEWLTEKLVPELVARFVRGMFDVLTEHPDVKRRFETLLGDLEHDFRWLESAWRAGPSGAAGGMWKSVHERLEALARMEGFVGEEGVDPDEAYRREVITDAVQLAAVIIRGLVADGVPTHLSDFDDERFDAYDLRAWLAKHGASQRLLGSQVVTGLYNASFCYPDGDFSHGNLSAGVSLRTLLLMGFTYKGAFMWKMRASMGDIVFAPIYEALLARGKRADEISGRSGSLKFEFFHRVQKLGLRKQPGERVIDTIEIARQAWLKNGTYEPLVTIKDLPCWPAKPLYDQLVDGDRIQDFDLESDFCSLPPVETRVLQRGAEDGFDHVVLAIPVGALKTICSELVDDSEAWAKMVTEVKTIRTQSFQVWLRHTPAQSSWQAAHHVMTDVYENPFNSVADMHQTLPFEDWPADREPGGVMYFSTAMPNDPNEPQRPDDRYPRDQSAFVGKEAQKWLAKWQEGIMGWLGPDYDPSAYLELYARANINHDERYVLSVASSTRHRLRPDESGYANLFLAGDWTKSTLNLGCAEGATMSGLEAGRAVVRALGEAPAVDVRRASVAAPAASTFVEYPGMPVFPPTYRQRDITLFQFALEADAAKLQTMVDRLLNPGAGGRPFQALGKWVLLQSGYIGGNSSSDLPWSEYGTGAEKSVSFLIPVVRWNGWGRGTSVIDVGFFAPYIFVDHPLSLIAGREVLGMAKQLASFDPPESLDEVTMSTMSVDPLGTGTPIVQAPLVHIRRRDEEAAQDGALGVREVVERSIAALVGRGPRSEAAPLGRVGTLLRAMLGTPRVRFFSLRQLRDGKVATRAAFQEVTRARMSLGSTSFQRPRTRHTIELVERASHPIARDLGLATGAITPVAELEVHIAEATLEREDEE